uniref:SAM domain-containing protein n=1 Tax=Chrysotila carterae TaxID=13221 RepID=A0A7S4B4C4_CHRCT
MSYQELEEVLPTKSVEASADVPTWSTRQVSEWVLQLGCEGHVASEFTKQRVTGDLMHELTEKHLEALGIDKVGMRLLVMREIARLRRKARAKQRFEVVWQATGLRPVEGPLDWLRQKIFCVACCDTKPDKYKLTNSSLILTQKDHSKASGFFSKAKRTRTIDLDSIAGVTANNSSELCDCGCVPDTIEIDLDDEQGLDPVDHLYVAHGEGSDIAAKITLAIEEAEAAVPMEMHR